MPVPWGNSATLADDMPYVLATSYVLTPEDPLHITIRAIQVWLNTHEIPNLGKIHTSMTQEELVQVLDEHYEGYDLIRPLCTMSEEEATTLIRAREVLDPADDIRQVYSPVYPDVELSSLPAESAHVPVICTIAESVAATALVELSKREAFLNQVKGRILVTLEDPEGVCYAALAHTGVFKAGYPHWSSASTWERDPLAIAGDACALPWSREAFLRYGPRSSACIPPGSLAVICRGSPSCVLSKESICLTCAVTPPAGAFARFKCHAFTDPFESWFLVDPSREGSLYERTSVRGLPTSSAHLALSLLHSSLCQELQSQSCMSPFGKIALQLGDLPTGPVQLALHLRALIRTATSTLARKPTKAPTYEAHVLNLQLRRERTQAGKRIGLAHIIMQMLFQKPWASMMCRGTAHYHTHKRPTKSVLCWRDCRTFSVKIMYGDARPAEPLWVAGWKPIMEHYTNTQEEEMSQRRPSREAVATTSDGDRRGATIVIPDSQDIPVRSRARKRTRVLPASDSSSETEAGPALGRLLTRAQAREILADREYREPAAWKEEVGRALEILDAVEAFRVLPTHGEGQGYAVRELLSRVGGRGLTPVRVTLRALGDVAGGNPTDRRVDELLALLREVRSENEELRATVQSLQLDVERLKQGGSCAPGGPPRREREAS